MNRVPDLLVFEQWYLDQRPRVLGALTVMAGDADVAAEVTAEAFTIAFERWDRVAGMESPGGWLHRVAVNAMRRRLRRRSLEHSLLRRTRPADALPNVAVEVWDAVSALPMQQRTAIALRYLLDLTQAEIAELMGIAPGTVSATLTAARRNLAPLLEPDSSDVEVSNA
jgi:RNA polymerase sigma-70 factor (ECF subfamily)